MRDSLGKTLLGGVPFLSPVKPPHTPPGAFTTLGGGGGSGRGNSARDDGDAFELLSLADTVAAGATGALPGSPASLQAWANTRSLFSSI
jgi:hypothetical protein